MSTFVSPDPTSATSATDATGAGDRPRAGAGAALVARAEFPLLAGDPALHYLDSAATAQKPRAVLDALVGYYTHANANPHRGAYRLSVAATDAYHDARRRVARFLGVADVDTLLFVRGTTEAMNLVAGSWGRANVGAGDEVVVTAMDHHATFVTWQQLALERGATFRICELTPDGRIDLEHLARLVGPRTRVVAFPHVSNALGTVNPVREIAALVRERSPAVVVVDGAQAVPHLRVELDRLAAAGVDFYAFSGHKVGGPMGIGALVGRRALLEGMPPWQYGGDMISVVEDQRSTWNALPHRFEAGTPNVADAVGLAAACDFVGALDLDAVLAHERALVVRAMDALSGLGGVRVHGPAASARSGVVSFSVDGVHPHDLATILDERGVCIRAGHHCTQPLMRRLGVSATARASFWVYSDSGDVDALVDGVGAAQRLFGAE